MAPVREVVLPDIGDFKDVEVIEVLVKPGDDVEAETPLITLESDKATMEVPSPYAGTVQSIQVKVGDRISEDAVILTLAERSAAGASAASVPEKTAGGAQQAPVADSAARIVTAETSPAAAPAPTVPTPPPSKDHRPWRQRRHSPPRRPSPDRPPRSRPPRSCAEAAYMRARRCGASHASWAWTSGS